MVGSINIIVVMIGGRIFFKETLSPRRITAIGLIAVGVALAGWA
jgi:EamA domain-containing membrane protein RarD